MASKVKVIADLAAMLPDKEQDFAAEFMRKLVLAWDPDFTKLTPRERERLEEAEREIANSETVSEEDIDWGDD